MLEQSLAQKEWDLAKLSELSRNQEAELWSLRNEKVQDKDTINLLRGDLAMKDASIAQLTDSNNGQFTSNNNAVANPQREIAKLKAANQAHQSQNAQLEIEV